MQARGIARAARDLLPSRTQAEKGFVRQEARLVRLERKQPAKITGRQVMLKDLMFQADESAQAKH
eukprot:2375136-Lingulodinium_polyedra.AAC.1